MKKALFLLCACLALPAGAQEENALTRPELAALKKKLVAVVKAVGEPAGYVKSSEDFSLPTTFNPDGKAFSPIGIGVSRELAWGAHQKAKKSADQLGEDTQKAMAAAMAKGDYAEMARLSEEVSQKSGQLQAEALETRRPNLRVRIDLNGGGSETLDPDKVLREEPGMLALRRSSSEEGGRGEVAAYFDPVYLKNTEKLTSISLPLDSGPSKLAVRSVTVLLEGPDAELDAWLKKVDAKAVLAQIGP